VAPMKQMRMSHQGDCNFESRSPPSTAALKNSQNKCDAPPRKTGARKPCRSRRGRQPLHRCRRRPARQHYQRPGSRSSAGQRTTPDFFDGIGWDEAEELKLI